MLFHAQIDPKRAIPRAEHAKSSKIFVGGLANTVGNNTLREFFGQFGNVLDAHVMLDRETNRSKGFGFVTFEDAESVDKALMAQGLELEGKPISVAERVSWPEEIRRLFLPFRPHAL